MAWGWTSKGRKDGNQSGGRQFEPAPLSRFEPIHRREMPQRREIEDAYEEPERAVVPEPPVTPLTKLMHEPAPARVYLTGLEEEPPITVDILRRALPDRFAGENKAKKSG